MYDPVQIQSQHECETDQWCYGSHEARTRTKTWGFPAVSPLGAELVPTRDAEEERDGTEREPGAKGASLNQLDYQTAVHERETYMLYIKPERAHET
jgi:hypothetical protein